MKLSDERVAEFNGRMNDWISKQGLLFQLTHGGTGLGGKPAIFGALIRAFVSLTLLVLLAAVGYAGFLVWKATGDELPKQFEAGIADGLGSDEVSTGGFKRDLSSGSYSEIIAKGNENTFYEHLEVRNLEFAMTMQSGLFGDWESQSINIGELKTAIKAGEFNAEQAANSWLSLFHERPSFSFKSLTIDDASISWGYNSPATWGSILHSELLANRTPDGWLLRFRGGEFSQGIFRGFEIEEIRVMLSRENGFSIPEAKLKADSGTFTWSGKMTSGGASPEFQFDGQLTSVPLSQFLPRGILSVVNGSLTGTVSGNGSLNNSDGIGFAFEVQPDASDGLYITKALTLLRLLSHLDSQRSYRRVILNQGSFKISSKGTGLQFSDIDLISQDPESLFMLAKLTGDFVARPATQEDLQQESHIFGAIAEKVSETIGATPQPNQQTDEEFEDEILRLFPHLQFEKPHIQVVYLEKGEVTDNRKAINPTTKDKGETTVAKTHLDFNLRRISRSPFLIDGNVKLSVPSSAFEGNTQLPNVSPPDGPANMQVIDLPLTDLVQRCTDKLNQRWEETMAERE